jgi:hypothetical protein
MMGSVTEKVIINNLDNLEIFYDNCNMIDSINYKKLKLLGE